MDSKSSEASPSLPQDVIGEILGRLPVKTLLRFRCVSKSWRSFIASEGFIKKHLHISSKNTAFTHHLFDHKPFYIIGCCNGLVCILKQDRIFLWNPSTKITTESPRIVDEDICLYANAAKIKYGFGWDESSGAYKVLVVWSNRKEWMSKVYSSKIDSWKTLQVTSLYNNGDFYGKGRFVSGKLYWLRETRLYHETDIPAVITFDLKTEEFGTMKLPCPFDSVVCLGVLGESLCAVCHYNKERPVWVMKEEECWVKVSDLLVYEPYQRFILVAPRCIRLKFVVSSVRESTFLVNDPWLPLNTIILSLTANVCVESLVSPIPFSRYRQLRLTEFYR